MEKQEAAKLHVRSFVICRLLLTKHCYGEQMNVNKACSRNRIDIEDVQNFYRKKWKKRDHFGLLGLDGLLMVKLKVRLFNLGSRIQWGLLVYTDMVLQLAVEFLD
jgi:hypothetical protein